MIFMKKDIMKIVNQIVDLPKLIFRLWLSMWIILLILTIGKIVFNVCFPIKCENEYFIKICDFIDNNNYLKYAIGSLFYLTSVNLWFLCSIKQKKYKNKIIMFSFNILILLGYFIKIYNNIMGFILELIYLIVIPIIINIVKTPFRKRITDISFPIIIYMILNLWQMNVLFVRGLREILLTSPYLVQLIMQIDYYIFLTITYIGVNYIMGWWTGGWFFGKTITEIKALREQELAKENPDKEFLKALDEKISEFENKNKNI